MSYVGEEEKEEEEAGGDGSVGVVVMEDGGDGEGVVFGPRTYKAGFSKEEKKKAKNPTHRYIRFCVIGLRPVCFRLNDRSRSSGPYLPACAWPSV